MAGYNGDDQPATYAQLNGPVFVVVSSSNQVYISESHRIRKIDRNGIISTIAGNGERGSNGNGQLAANAQLHNPRGLFVTEDEEVFIADMWNLRVIKIDRNGIISTIHLGLFFSPSSVFQYKNEIYITDIGYGKIRKILQDGKAIIINTIEDDTGLDNTSPLTPYFVVVFNDELFVSYTNQHMVRKIHLSNGNVETLIGNGNVGSSGDGSLAKNALLTNPGGIFVDENAQVYISDHSNHRIRRIDRNGIVDTIVGTGTPGY